MRDIIESLRRDGGLKTIEVRDTSNRVVHQAGNSSTTDFRRVQPIELAGQRYGEVVLALSGTFIQEARSHYIQQSLFIAAAALLRWFGVDLVQGYHLDRPIADHPALSR